MGVNRLAAVGAFVLGGGLLFAVGLFMIGDRRMLFGDTFRAHAEFAAIAGLESGATVRLSGLQAGEVEAIHVPTRPGAPFRVRMRIRGDLRPLVRLDSIASIQNDGLVGNKFVQIEVGTEQSPVVPDEGTIRSREPFDLADLLQKMSDTIETVNHTVLNVKEEVDVALHALTATAHTAQGLVEEVGADARVIMAATEKVAEDLRLITTGLREGRGTIGQLLTDDALYQRAKAIAAEVEQVVANVRRASEDARAAIADFRGDDGPVKGLTGDLQHTLTAARTAMVNLAENTEALKRNFLFRGFFQRRGYFDLDEVSVQQYRAGALESGDRRALRIWLRGDLLFEPDEERGERLTDDGRARLDSAMSQFIRYRGNGPLVVEGYAGGLTADERYLNSRGRAQLVRDYVVPKYGLDPSLVTTMAMGNQAVDSPSGEKWDGVALALFVDRSVLNADR